MKRLRRYPWQGLYAITDASLAGGNLAARVEQAIAGGARVIQYRDKGRDAPRREREARALLAVCGRHGVPLLINDDAELAARIGAQGVHIGRDDGDLAAVRALLGPEPIIGVSCYNRLALAREAAAGGADYVAFGRFFPSATKPEAVPASLDLLRTARRELDCPLVAIGGITAENARPLIEAGADMLAVIRGVFAATDVTAAARRIAQAFNHPESPS